MGSSGRFDYTIGFKTDDSGLKQARKALQEIQKLTLDSPGVSGMQEDLNQAKIAATELETALTKSFNVKMGTTSVAKLNQELKGLNLNQVYEDMKAIGPAGEAAFNKVAAQALKTNLQIKQGSTLLDKFGKTLWRNVEWLISGNLINSVTGIFTKAYGYTKNLDSSLNDIRIVTGKGADEMARFGKEAQETAAKLGKGTTDITNASLIFYQQGLDQAEVNARTEVTAKMSNVTKQSAETVADQMTAIWNGFKAGSDELEHYADVMTAIAASTASSSSELAGAISKVSSIAHTTGVDMEQLSAMISTVISVTRDSPETVGTAFKTIFARMDDLVEDGTDEFGVSLGRVSSHLANMGIEILNEDGTLRDLGDTLTETGEKWKSYSREQQVAIAEQMGGKRQWNQVLALFDNWDKYSDALDVARDSTGALQEQQDIYMESTQAHLQAVKTAWEGVYGELMTADNINTVADVLTKVLNTVKSIIQAMGGVKPILTQVAGLMIQAFSNQVAANVVRIADNIKKADYNKLEKAAQQSLTAQFGQLDSSLMQELTGYHAKILKYQSSMSDKQREEYETLIDARVEAENKYKTLKQENDVIDKLLEKYQNINSLRDKNGNLDMTRVTDAVANSQGTIEFMTENEAIDTQSGRSLSLGWTDEDQQRTEQEISLMENLDDLTAGIHDKVVALNDAKANSHNPQEIDELTQLTAAYRSVEEETRLYAQAVSDGDETAMAEHEVAVRTAINSLQQLEMRFQDGISDVDTYAYSIKNSIDCYQQMAETLSDSATPMESAKQKIAMIKTGLQDMAKAGVLTQEQVNQLSQEYDNFGDTITENTSSARLTEGFDQLKQKVLQTGKITSEELKRMLDGLNNGIPQATANVKAQVDNIKASMQDFEKGLDFQAVTKNITSMLGAVTQLCGAWESLKNLGNIWDDESLSTWDKLGKSIQSVASIGLMLIPALSNMRAGFIGLTTSIGTAINTTGSYAIAEKAVQNMSEQEIRLTAVRKLQQDGMNESDAFGAVAEMSKADAEGIATVAIAEETMATEGAAAAQTKLNAAMLANPIGLIIAAVVAAVVAIGALQTLLMKLIPTFDKDYESANGFLKVIYNLFFSFGLLFKKIVELVKVLKEEDEAQKRAQETFDKYSESVKGLADAYDEMAKKSSEALVAIGNFKDKFDAFDEGRLSVEDFNSSLDSLVEKLDLTEEELEELEEIRRKAAVTGDYSDVEDFVSNKEDEERQSIITAKTTGKVTAAKSSAVVDFIQNVSDVETDALNGSDIDSDDRDRITGKASRWIGENLSDVITEDGFDLSEITAANMGDVEALYTEEKEQELQKMIDNAKGAEKRYYQELYDSIYTGRWEAIKKASEESEAFSKAMDSGLLSFDENTSEKVINDNLKKYAKSLKKGLQEANPDLSDEEIDKLAWKQAVDDALLISPDAQASIDNIELYGEQTADALTSVYTKYADTWLDEGKKVYYGAVIDPEKFADAMDAGQMGAVNEQLKEVGLNLNSLGDFSDLSEESIQALMDSIMTGAPLSADAIKQISKEVNEADQAIAFANLDFDDLSQKGEEWYTKLKENKVSPSDLVDNKGYTELLGQVGALGEAFNNEELNEAIDIISHPDAHDVDELADAWKVANKYIAEGDLEAPVVELNKALKDLKKNDVYKDGRHLVMTAELDVDEAEKKLDKFLDADRSIEVTIDTKMDEASEQLKTDISDSADLAGKIGEGFTASLDDLDELSAAFPGILDGMTMLSDGSIQLSQDAVAAAAETAKQEMDDEIDKQILKYKIQNDLLQYKKDKYDEALEAAAKMQKTEYTNEEDLDKDITGLMDIMDEVKEADRAATLVAEDKLTDNMLSKWEEYYTNAALMNENFTSTMIANMNKDADDTAEMWDANAVKSKFVTKQIVDMTMTSEGPKYTYETKVDNAAVHDYAQRVQDSIKERQAEIDKQMADNLNQIKILEAYKQSNATTWKNVGKATDATEDNTDATEENAEAQAELIELLILEADIYHDINREISNLNRAMSRLQDQQDKLTGKALADNLQEQIDLLDKQVDAKERWLKTASTDLATKSLALRDYGVKFDENGEISNYKEMYDEANDIYQAKVDWYNSLSKEEQEEAQAELEAAEARKDALEGYIKDYEDVKDSIDDAVDEIQGYLDQKIEKQVSKWKIEFEIDFSEAERKRSKLEFQKYMAGIAEDDILGNTAFSVQTLATYLGEHGDMAASSRQYQELLEMKRRFDAGDMTTIYGDNGAKLQEDLDAAEDKWMEISKTVKDIEDTIKNSLLDLYDQAAEKLEEQRNSYKAISDLLEHDINLIKLRFGEQSYGKISKLLQQQRDLTEKQLQSAIAERDYFYQQLQKALESDPEMKEEATKKLAEHYKTALATVSSFAEEMANILYTNFENTVNDLFASMMEKLSGEYSLDYMKTEWDRIKAEADDYYDTVNAAYEIEKYQLQLKKAISETNDTATQKKLTDLMNNQVKLMQNKDKLSKYDVERANALFDIEQKRAAWQEAQNNKSKMRLRRDSNGNYSYQFVSDENKTADSLQALADAQNSLYNLDKDAIRANTEEINAIYTEMYAAIEEDAKNGGEHLEEIRNYYLQRIEQKVRDHELLRQNYQSTTFEELSKLTGTAIEDYEQLTDIEKEALMLEQDPLWGTALMKSVSSSEAFMGALESTTSQAISAAREYIATFDETIDSIGKNWQEMAEGSQPMVDMLDNLTLSTDTLVESLNEATQKLAECILLLGDSPTSLSEAMNIFGTDFSKLMETMTQSAVVFENVSKSAQSTVDAAAIISKQQTGNVYNDKNSNRVESGAVLKTTDTDQKAIQLMRKPTTKEKMFDENEMPKVGDKVKFLGGLYYEDSYGTGRSGDRGPGKEVTIYSINEGAPYPISVISDDSAFGWLRKDQIAKFDKGGYTGKWGPEGKVAILHEKEMVLNQDMIETIQHYNQAIQDKIKAGAESTREKLIEKINRIQDYQNQLEIISILGRFKNTLEQIASEPKNMNVDAHFPNVSTAGEIEKAFKNLTNITTQNTYTSWR